MDFNSAPELNMLYVMQFKPSLSREVSDAGCLYLADTI